MFIQRLRAKIGARLNGDSEAGFTLIELLVVMLILGILAAIALPAFFNQRSKANDSSAKSTANSAQTAMETFATEHNGSYAGATLGDLHEIEPTLPAEPSAEELANEVVASVSVESTSDSYTITVTAPTTEDKFSVERLSSGEMRFPCEPKTTTNRGGCPSTNFWG